MIEITPITFKEAKEFVNEHHRHNVAPQGQKFSIGVKEDGALIGVYCIACIERADAGLPSPIHADDDRVVRCDCFEAIPEEGDSE
jgi:hypothetical protein